MPGALDPLEVCVLDGRIANLGVDVGGRSVRLTVLEWVALERLVRRPGHVIPLETLAAYLYAHALAVPVSRLRATRCVLRRLRQKLRSIDALPLVQNRRGHGYVVPADRYEYQILHGTLNAVEEPRRLSSDEGETQSPRRME